MRIIIYLFLATFFIAGCDNKENIPPNLEDKQLLKKPLTEISGLAADSNYLWAITDKPKANLYKLDRKGNLLQEIKIKDVEAIDIEDIAHDDQYAYIADIGDNEGDRQERQIFKVSKKSIPGGAEVEVSGEIISFSLANDEVVEKKKKNNYDCEALVSYGDSLYLFTKRREDQQTELFVIPKTPGNHIAYSKGIFNSKGLITGAALNKANNELALVGYDKGHKYPFILLFNDFQGSDFFTSKVRRIELADKEWDWQIESIAYDDQNNIYFACEETKEVKSTLYVVKREKLMKLHKNR